MNIEILPPGGDIKYLRHLITFRNVVEVEFDYRNKCARATLKSRQHNGE